MPEIEIVKIVVWIGLIIPVVSLVIGALGKLLDC